MLKYKEDYAQELFDTLDQMMGELWSDNRARPLDAEDLLEAISMIEASELLERTLGEDAE